MNQTTSSTEQTFSACTLGNICMYFLPQPTRADGMRRLKSWLEICLEHLCATSIHKLQKPHKPSAMWQCVFSTTILLNANIGRRDRRSRRGVRSRFERDLRMLRRFQYVPASALSRCNR